MSVSVSLSLCLCLYLASVSVSVFVSASVSVSMSVSVSVSLCERDNSENFFTPHNIASVVPSGTGWPRLIGRHIVTFRKRAL